MKIRILIIVFGLSVTGMVKAQTYVPPTFGTDCMNTRLDEISRLYVPPKKVMWISNDSLVKNTDVLLLPGTGQTELSKRNTCSMFTSDRDTASILLDYGYMAA